MHILYFVPCVKALLDLYTQIDLQLSSSPWEKVSIQSPSDDSYQRSLGLVGEAQQLYPFTPMCSITDGDSILKYWKKGIFYQGPRQGVALVESEQVTGPSLFFRVESLEGIEGLEEVVQERSADVKVLGVASPPRSGVCITTSPTTEGVRIYGQIIDLCEKLLIEWYPEIMEHTKQQIPCYSCLQEKHYRPALFQKDILMEQIDHTVEEVGHSSAEDAATKINPFILSCGNGHSIPLLEVAPDILLGDLHRDFLLPHSEVVYTDGQLLGRGYFSEVHLCTYQEKDVAVKLYIKGVSESLREL